MSLCKWILVLIFLSISAHSRAEDCLSHLPDSLRSAVEQDNWKIVEPHDLSASDLRVWINNHPDDCPGVAEGNFSPRAKTSYIVALIQRDDRQNLLEKVDLVILKKNRPEVEDAVTTIEVATPYVVWKLAKGRYLGIDGTRASIPRNSFVFEKLVGPASQYYYHGNQLKSFVISR